MLHQFMVLNSTIEDARTRGRRKRFSFVANENKEHAKQAAQVTEACFF